MKKYISAFVFLALFSPFVSIQETQASVQSYWDIAQKKQSSSLALRIRALKEKASRERQGGSYPTYRKTTTTSQQNLTNRIRANRTIYPARNFEPSTTTSEQALQITSRPIGINQPISEISDKVIPLFDLGLRHTRSYQSSNFVPAINVDKIAFRLIDNNGIVSDASLFSLVVDGEEFRFERTGRVVIDFNNLRLASGESRNIEIGIKPYDSDNLPRLNGSFRVRIDSASATKESTFATVPAKLIGPSISKFITLYPRSETTGTPVLAGTPATIFSRTISAGEKETVLGLKLGAVYDDMIVREITVRNIYGNSIDSWVNKINLINYNNDTIVASTRFVNGKATFNVLGNKIQIPRNSKVHLGFEVELSSTINTSQNTQFKLDIQSTDVEVWGLGTGREVPTSQKTISLDAQPFFVAQNGGNGGIFPSSNQPNLFPTGQVDPIYRFKIVNNGNREFSVSRFTMGIYPNGMSFVGGGASDFALHRSYQGHDFNQSDFSTQVVGTNTVRFDAQNEIYVPAHGTAEFSLRVALNNTGASDNRSIGVKLLGDANLQKGTLSSVRASGANFIWSDRSGAPHTNGSADWISGYFFPGLPTQTFVNKQ